jgi:hypothetical protein
MNIKFRDLLLIVSLLSICTRLEAAEPRTFLVAPDGDDSGLGGTNLPFKTIAHAVEIALPGDLILVEPGTYHETIIINNSGTEEKPITIAAQKFGTAVIDGAEPLSGWTLDGGTKPVYTTAWDHDFFYSPGVRTHFGPKADGASTAIGYAEQFIEADSGSPERVLVQVIHYEDLTEGTFFVDYSARKVSVWLKGGANPSKINVLASTRSLLLSAGSGDGSYITLKGLTFRHAANFAQKWAVRTGEGWRMEDCLAERCNGGGIGVAGNNVTLLRVTAQDNGQQGIGGGKNTNATLQDCVSQRNNYKGFSASNEAGGGKFVATDGLRILNCSYRDNNGTGLWLDFKNKNYLISGGTYTGNHFEKPKYMGIGIMIELSEGPGTIENCWFSDNSGAGIQVGESMKVTIKDSTFIHNYLDLRDAPNRAPYHISDLTITGNRFKETFVSTSLGAWLPTAIGSKRITLDGNTYDNSPTEPMMNWGKVRAINSLIDARAKLGVETNGKTAPIDPAQPLAKLTN